MFVVVVYTSRITHSSLCYVCLVCHFTSYTLYSFKEGTIVIKKLVQTCIEKKNKTEYLRSWLLYISAWVQCKLHKNLSKRPWIGCLWRWMYSVPFKCLRLFTSKHCAIPKRLGSSSRLLREHKLSYYVRTV